MNGAAPVRPQETMRNRDSADREMCDVDEANEKLFEYKAAEQEGGEHDHGEEEEEGLVPKIKKVVPKPTPEEVEKHMASHIPFREWCPHFVAGKSKTDPRLRGKREQQMGMILVGREENSGWHMAAAVPSKGTCAHAARKL